MNAKYLVGIAVIIILAAGGYAIYANSAKAPAGAESGSEGTDMRATTTESGPMGSNDSGAGVSAGAPSSAGSATVAYTPNGFSPSSITIKKGESITFVNESGDLMWIASDAHPLHAEYDGTTREEHCAPGYAGPAPFDECDTGASFTFTFDKVGTWGYHNHAADEDGGTVVVTE